jgi:hypothetical protein
LIGCSHRDGSPLGRLTRAAHPAEAEGRKLATAALLGASWFDVATALGTPDQAVALLEAALELPLALGAGTLALRLARAGADSRPDARRYGAMPSTKADSPTMETTCPN